MRAAILSVAALAFSAVTMSSVWADDYPNKPIHIVVPVAPGGTVDMMSRLIAKGLADELKQPVIVENKAGVSGLIGTRYVAHSEPNGYTLLAIANTFVSAPAFMPDAGYDPLTDFTPITQTCQIPMVLVAHPSVPETGVQALIARAKAHPGEITVASSGVGSTGYIAAELFSRQAGIKLLGVPYKGNAQALTDLVGGQVMMMFDQVSTSGTYVLSHKLRALAVTTSTRSLLLPDVPTVAESGLPGYEDVTFNAMMAPAGTPEPVIAKLHAAISRVLDKPDLKRQLLALGIEVKTSQTPADFGAYLQNAAKTYRVISGGAVEKK